MIDIDAPREVAEWVGRTPDQQPPPRVKLRVYLRDKGACCKCGRKLNAADKPEFDHIVALVNGGANRESNLQTLCGWHHKEKSREDVAIKSKTARVRSRHVGIKRTKQPIKGWRRFDGTPVRNPRLNGTSLINRD